MDDDSKWINATIESNEGVENKTAKVSVIENSTSKKRKGAILVIPTDTLNMIGRDNLLTADNDFTEAAIISNTTRQFTFIYFICAIFLNKT